MKRILVFLLTLCLLSISAAGLAEAAPEGDNGVFPAIAGEAGTTYVSLFDVILADEYAPLWHDFIAPVTGDGAADAAVTGLQGSISGQLYGEDAIAAFADNPEHIAFDCFFINGVEAFTFEGSDVTVKLTDGTTETHTYAYLGQYNVGDGETMNYQGQEISVAFPCDVYKSTDEAGEFNYFFLRDDTMASTYHTEFRYGRDLEALQGYFVGPYAYWLAAGIDANADADTIKNVIELFCLENMSYTAHTEEALAQLDALGFVGTWQADLAALGDEYEGVDLSMTIDEQGHGVTLMNGQQTADFEAFASDTGEAGDGEGLYVAYSNIDFDAESAPYIMGENEDGQAVLTLVSDEGALSWVRQDGEASAVTAEAIEIDSAEALAAINENLSGSYVLTADIDLAGIDWTPIGAYAPSGESAEEQETPAADVAFTGTFDGQGHTISNLTINKPEAWAQGLFGCIANANVGNFTVENAAVDGTIMVSDVVGYAFSSNVHDVTLVNGKVTAHASEMSAEGMYGGIVGAGMGSVIAGCSAQADIVLPDNTANAGIVGGGLEMTSVIGCTASGTVSAGNNCYGLGGVSGCGFGAEEFTGNTADGVTITAGDNCFWIGGITGYAGGFEAEEAGIPVTAVSGCAAKGVAIVTGENAEGVSAIVGAGFFNEAAAQAMGAPFDQPTVFNLTDCTAEGVTLNGEAIE